jgi:dipeptidyl-peptidase-4
MVAAATIISVSAFAQKKLFTIAEATNGMSTTLALKGIKQPSWEPGTNKLYQVVKTEDGAVWIATRFPADKTDTVFSLRELNTAVYAKQQMKAMPELTWLSEGLVYFQDGNDLKKGTRTASGYKWEHWLTLPDDATNVTVDKSHAVAYTIGNNLWLITKDKKKHQITNDENPQVVNGRAVHREEFGIDKGIFFSPDGNYVAYYKMDQSMVKEYPIVKWDDPASVDYRRYPMAGATSHQVTLHVYNPVTGKSVAMNTEGPKDQYLTCVTWSPDERYLYTVILNRQQNHLVLNSYNIQNGKKVSTILEEKHDKYVEPLNPLTFIPGSNNRFIWWSQRDGYMHLYVYNTDGQMEKRLTKGKWIVNEIVGLNKKSQEIIFTSSKESPLEKHTYTVNWNTGRMARIDKEAGVHTTTVNEDGTYLLDVFTGAGIPKRTVVRSVDGDYDKVLVEAANTLAKYDRPEIKNITLKASDGTPLYGKLILPLGFDAKKKYPVVVYLYNGPHVQIVKNTFPESGNLWYEYMAQRGYVVFSMDGRGSSNRGLAFEQAVFRQLGTVEMEDQLKGVEYLKSLPFVDADRMGVHGWSFGGFMTTSLMLRHPGVFKVGVAGGPVIDWKLYEAMYTERYMDTPEENPKGYEDANLLNKVQNLKGKLLMIHGTNDTTVVWQHSIKFIKKAVSENVQVDYFVYPGYEHNVRGKDRVHLMQKISDYFDLYLKRED